MMRAFIVIGSSKKFCHGNTVLPLNLFPQTQHSIKYTTILELQLKFFFI